MFTDAIKSANEEVTQQRLKDAIRSSKKAFLDLIQPEQYLGEIYSLNYEIAAVMIHDHHRRNAGGIPSLSFLIATRLSPLNQETNIEEFDFSIEDSSILLLRVMDAAKLPTDDEATRIRVQSARSISGEHSTHWDSTQAMDSKTHHELSFAGVQCRVVGTFFLTEDEETALPKLAFGSDISNYYPNQGLKVYKPNDSALQTIINYRTSAANDPVQIGHIRYASTNRRHQGVDNVSFAINPSDLLDQKTALFGMTRTGKSNTTKVMLTSVFKLRYSTQTQQRVGQIIFDPNGEYGNENDQNVALTNVWRLQPNGDNNEVVVYGTVAPPHDPERRLLRLNFLTDDNLQTGKEIVDVSTAHNDSQFMRAFRNVSLLAPDPNDRSATTRHRRRVLVYRTLLIQSGFAPPENDTGMRDTQRLFSEDLIVALQNATGENQNNYQAAARILSQRSPSWGQLFIAFAALEQFIRERTTGYDTFDQRYINRSNGSGEPWADTALRSLLEVFRQPNGIRQIGAAREQHTGSNSQDYADEIYQHLVHGRMVIVDQSLGSPPINQAAADRIMWSIFNGNQEQFRQGTDTSDFPHILVYIEEAHNILPSGTDMDLQNVWVRTAKEGAKYHIGMVYVTQEVSSIQRNILKNTANWFIGHLNNTDETRELRKFYDFADFEKSILRAQDKGFLRIKTLSNPFVVPVQVELFHIEIEGGN